MKKLFLISLLLLSLSVYSQHDRQYEPLEFENYQCKWFHPVIDSTLIGKIRKVDYNGDTLYHDGFSNFFGVQNFRVKPVIYQNNIYIVEQLWKGFGPDGTFIQCLDINTGKIKWQTRFYKEGNRKELSRYAYVDKEKHLNILGLKEYKSNNCHGCYHMITRQYDMDTGVLLKKTIVSESNQESADLYPIPLFPGSFNIANNHLFPYEDKLNRYFFCVDGLLSYFLNDSSQIVAKDTFSPQHEYNYIYDSELFRTDNGNLIYFLHEVDGQNFTKDDFGYYFNFLDKDMNVITSKNLHGIIKPVRHGVYFINVYNDDNYFIIHGIDSLRNQTDSIMDMATYSLFDTKGNLIEEVSITNDDGDPFEYGNKNKLFGKATKLRHEDGMLIVFASEYNDSNKYLNFRKTDGKGNIEYQKRFKITNTTHTLLIIDIMQLENGDVILQFLDSDANLVEEGYNNFATVYALFEAKDLKLKTNIVDQVISQNNVKIYPNPSNGNLTLLSSKDVFGQIIVFDITGKKVYDKKFDDTNEIKIDLSNMNSGLYVAKLYNNSIELGSAEFIIAK